MKFLFFRILKQQKPFQSRDKTVSISIQLLDIILYLHIQEYSHHNIKSDNILLESVSSLTVQLSGFRSTNHIISKSFSEMYKYVVSETCSTIDDPDSGAMDI